MSKPKVRYADVGFVTPGFSATVLPLDHPSDTVSNTTWARTSPVQKILYQSSNGPVFETLNTIYLSADTIEHVPEASAVEAVSP